MSLALLIYLLDSLERFHDPISVKDSSKISNEDFCKCTSNRPDEFVLLSKVEIEGVI